MTKKKQKTKSKHFTPPLSTHKQGAAWKSEVRKLKSVNFNFLYSPFFLPWWLRTLCFLTLIVIFPKTKSSISDLEENILVDDTMFLLPCCTPDESRKKEVQKVATTGGEAPQKFIPTPKSSSIYPLQLVS